VLKGGTKVLSPDYIKFLTRTPLIVALGMRLFVLLKRTNGGRFVLMAGTKRSIWDKGEKRSRSVDMYIQMD
jgi:hypothetical protein